MQLVGRVLAVAGVLALPVRADEPVNAGVRIGYYQQLDKGGIAQIDENGNVFQALVLVDVPVSDRDRVSGRVLVDVVSSASIVRAHNSSFRAAQSGASGALHFDGGLSYAHRFDHWDLSVGVSGSWDYAYRSMGGSAGVGLHLLDDTATLRLGLSGFYDTLAMIRFNGEDDPDQARWTLAATLGWSQILGPKTVLDTSITHTSQGGFLAGQFNSVFFGAVEAAELLPETRHRTAFTARVKQGLGAHHAIDVGARYYLDTWGIQAGTAEGGYSVYLDSPHHYLLHLGYRFYLQGPADDYAPGFAAGAALDLRTSDPDLGGFIGHMATVKFTMTNLFGENTGDIDLEGNYYARSSGLDMFWFALGYTFSR